MEELLREKIKKAEELISDAEIILVGIGEEFEVPAPDFSELPECVRPFALSRYYAELPEENEVIDAYRKLRAVIGSRLHFAVTLNTDDLIFRSGFWPDFVVAPCGSMGKLQCEEHIVDAAPVCKQVLSALRDQEPAGLEHAKRQGQENTAHGGQANTAHGGQENTAHRGQENMAHRGQENMAHGDHENTAHRGQENMAHGGQGNTVHGRQENTARDGKHGTDWKRLVSEYARCPKCGAPLKPHVRSEEGYLEEGYLPQWQSYQNWLTCTLNKKLCILELGAGFRYPQVIRWPFERLAFFNQKASLIRVHSALPQMAAELGEKGISIKCTPLEFLAELHAAVS